MKLETWGGQSDFEYEGNFQTGYTIIYGGTKNRIFIPNKILMKILNTFHKKTIPIGTSRDNPPSGSLGEWLLNNFSKTAIASYLGAILVKEGYAFKNKINIIFK